MQLEGLVIPISWQAGGLIRGLEVITDAITDAIDETVKYAAAVQKLSALSGAATGETSRFIQVIDDYGLTARDAEVATRALTKNGLAPTTETLAMLSDQYLKLNTVQEKNQFILDNLGRAGFEWVNVLNQGSAAIREQSAAVDENLVLNAKAVEQARIYALAVDDLDDSFLALKIQLGQELLPILTDLIDWFLKLDERMKAINPSIKIVQNYAAAWEWVKRAVSGISIPNLPATGGGGPIAGRRAAGGPASGLTWVGENGPEIVNLPGGSYVNNAQASASMGFDYYKLAAILAVEFAKVRD
jgi:hypothetical protein